jgi:hypothetical protein
MYIFPWHTYCRFSQVRQSHHSLTRFIGVSGECSSLNKSDFLSESWWTLVIKVEAVEYGPMVYKNTTVTLSLFTRMLLRIVHSFTHLHLFIVLRTECRHLLCRELTAICCEIHLHLLVICSVLAYICFRIFHIKFRDFFPLRVLF